MSRFLQGTVWKLAGWCWAPLKAHLPPLVTVLSPLHVIYPVSCQSTGLIVLVCQQRCVKCKDGKVLCPKGKSGKWSQLKSCSTRWQYDSVVWWHVSLKYPMTFMSAFFSLSVLFWHGWGEGRYFHSIQRHAWAQRSQRNCPSLLLIVGISWFP